MTAMPVKTMPEQMAKILQMFSMTLPAGPLD
jgi:hypothetical protein